MAGGRVNRVAGCTHACPPLATPTLCSGCTAHGAQFLTMGELRSSEPVAESAWTRRYGAAVGATIAVSKPCDG
jgi:hypothetical protein